jgi:hypothetical protein
LVAVPTEIGRRQASGAFKRGVSLGRRSESTSEVWFGEELRNRSRSPPVAAGALTSARQPLGSSVTQTATAPQRTNSHFSNTTHRDQLSYLGDYRLRPKWPAEAQPPFSLMARMRDV